MMKMMIRMMIRMMIWIMIISDIICYPGPTSDEHFDVKHTGLKKQLIKSFFLHFVAVFC